MNTLKQHFLFLALLGSAMVLLPACGGSGNVKSQKAAETVLNAEPTPTATVVNTDVAIPVESHEAPINAYVEKIKRTKSGKGTKITLTPSAPAPTPEPTAAPAAPAPNPAPPMETKSTTAPTGGSHWFWWLLLVLALGGIGWYLKSKSDSDEPGRPNPPVGGLSPVSGFTGMKKSVEEKTKSKPSIWSKKLF